MAAIVPLAASSRAGYKSLACVFLKLWGQFMVYVRACREVF